MTAAPAPFQNMVAGGYDVIVADPPWRFRLWNMENNAKSPGKHYGLMTTADVAAIPVGALAAPDCMLFLWTSAPMLFDGWEVAKAWGFPKYVSRTAWRKVFESGKQAMGPGYWVRTMHEDVLIFTRGKPKISKALPSLFEGIRREHSRKPDEFYDLLRDRTPDKRRADIFSRETRRGFTGWGNEHGKFDDGITPTPLFCPSLVRAELALMPQLAALQSRLSARVAV